MQIAIHCSYWQPSSFEVLKGEFRKLIEERQSEDDIYDVILEIPNILEKNSDPVSGLYFIQDTLVMIYGELYSMAYEHQLPLLNLNVILGGWCGYCPFQTRKYSLVISVPNARSANILEEQITTGKQAADNLTGRKGYSHVAVGGTFDHLHIGHKILLTMSLWLSTKKLTCGVYGFKFDSLNKKTAFEEMESLEVRVQTVKNFLSRMNRERELNVVEIYDQFGPTSTDESIEALVGSVETRMGCDSVNETRLSNGLPPLHIYLIPTISEKGTVNCHDFIHKISSSILRKIIQKRKS